MKRIFYSIIAVFFLIMAVDLPPVHAVEWNDEEGKEARDLQLVSITPKSEEYCAEIGVRLPEMKVAGVNVLTNVKTFLLQLKVTGDVSDPRFVFQESISQNAAVTVQDYMYDESAGIFTIVVSGTESVFQSADGMVDLGELRLWENGGKADKPSRVEVSVLDYQIVNGHSQQPVDIGYEDASNSVVFEYQEHGSGEELGNLIGKAAAYIGDGGVESHIFAGIPIYDDLAKAYQAARSALETGDGGMMDAAYEELEAAVKGFERIHGLLDTLTKAHSSLERAGAVDFAKLNEIYQEAMSYLRSNASPQDAEVEKYVRLVKFETFVADLRLSVAKSQLTAEEKGRYTRGNLAVWERAMNAAEDLLKRRDAMGLDEIGTLPDIVPGMADDLDGACAGLIDVTELKVMMGRAREVLEERNKYTETTMQALDTALAAARDFLSYAEEHVIVMESAFNEKGEIVQNGYGRVLALLTGAIDGRKERVSSAEVKETLDWIEEQKQSDYLPDAFQSLLDSAAQAKTVIENSDSTQDQVQEALDALNHGISSLERTDGNAVSAPEVTPSVTSFLPDTGKASDGLPGNASDGLPGNASDNLPGDAPGAPAGVEAAAGAGVGKGVSFPVIMVSLALGAVCAEAALVCYLRISRRKKRMRSRKK